MEGPRQDAWDSSRRFLEKLCIDIDNSSPEDDEVPLRLTSSYLVEAEVEGECLDWSLQYLQSQGCPGSLSVALARAAYLEVAGLDFAVFYADRENDDSEKHNKEPQLDARRFFKHVIQTLHNLCKKWQQHFPSLDLPQHSLKVSSYAIKNTRRKMEDRHVILPDLNSLFGLKACPSLSYLSVFDGHGGLEAAVYAASHLHCHLVHDPAFPEDIATALRSAYTKTDQTFLQKAKQESLRSGTTAVSIVIEESKFHVAWLGDSQAVLVKNGQAFLVMDPHKPERPDEKARIEALGGCVLFLGVWRVNGNMAVSRAIGDAPHKPYISSEADVKTFDLDGDEEYIVLACDGAWDAIAPENLPAIVHKHVSSGGTLNSVAEHLVTYARDNGSTDNISVVVVFFRDHFQKPGSAVAARADIRENGENFEREAREGGGEPDRSSSKDSKKGAKGEKDGTVKKNSRDGTNKTKSVYKNLLPPILFYPPMTDKGTKKKLMTRTISYRRGQARRTKGKMGVKRRRRGKVSNTVTARVDSRTDLVLVGPKLVQNHRLNFAAQHQGCVNVSKTEQKEAVPMENTLANILKRVSEAASKRTSTSKSDVPPSLPAKSHSFRSNFESKYHLSKVKR